MLIDPLGDALAEAKASGLLFAVVDAAQVDYLQDELSLGRLKFDPLYLDEIDAPSIATGPHLVTIQSDRDIALVRSIVGDTPACVWWIWPDEPNASGAIYRHLRGLNMVEIPRDRADQEDEDVRGPGYETVLFRHADPNVVISILPVLYEEQITRFFGGASAVIVESTDYKIVRKFERPAERSAVPRGMLRIGTPEQYEAYVDEQDKIARDEIVEFLRENAAEETATIDDEALYGIVIRAEKVGLELGMESNEAHALFAFVSLTTSEAALTAPEFRAAFANTNEHPDDVMEAIFDDMIRDAEIEEGY